MIYIKNNTEIQTIFIPRSELQKEAYIASTKTYEDGYKDGFGMGKQYQKDQLLNLYVTENGVYERNDGFGTVTVDIQQEGGECNLLDFQMITLKEEAEKHYASDYGADGFAIVSIDAVDLCKQKYNEGFEEGKSQGGGEGTTYPTIADIYNSEVGAEVTFKATVAGKFQNKLTYYLIVTDHTGAYSINFRNECPLNVGDECVFTGLNRRNNTTLIRYMQVPTNYEVLSSNNYVVLPAEALNIKDIFEVYSPNEYGNTEIKYVCFEGEIASFNESGGTMRLNTPISEKGITLRGFKQEWQDNFAVGDNVKVYGFTQESSNYVFPFEMVKLGGGSCTLGEEWIILGQNDAGATYELIASDNGYDGYSKVTIEVENFTADCPMSEIWTAYNLSNRIVNDNISGGEEYVRGTITSIQEVKPQYGNATYVIDDVFKVYRGKWFDGNLFEDENQIQVGDWVIVKGTTQNYNGQAQFKAGSQVVEHKRCEGGGNCDDAYNSGFNQGFTEGYETGFGDGQANCGGGSANLINPIIFSETEGNTINAEGVEIPTFVYEGNQHYNVWALYMADYDEFKIQLRFQANNGGYGEPVNIFGCEDTDWDDTTFGARIYEGQIYFRMSGGDVSYPYSDYVWYDVEMGYNSSKRWIIVNGETLFENNHSFFNKPSQNLMMGAINSGGNAFRPFYGKIGAAYIEANGSQVWLLPKEEGYMDVYWNDRSFPWVSISGENNARFEKEFISGDGMKSITWLGKRVSCPSAQEQITDYIYNQITLYSYRNIGFDDFEGCFYDSNNEPITDVLIVRKKVDFEYSFKFFTKVPIKTCSKIPYPNNPLYGLTRLYFKSIPSVNLNYKDNNVLYLYIEDVDYLNMNGATLNGLLRIWLKGSTTFSQGLEIGTAQIKDSGTVYSDGTNTDKISSSFSTWTIINDHKLP